jgi:hypothetical protein
MNSVYSYRQLSTDGAAVLLVDHWSDFVGTVPKDTAISPAFCSSTIVWGSFVASPDRIILKAGRQPWST